MLCTGTGEFRIHLGEMCIKMYRFGRRCDVMLINFRVLSRKQRVFALTQASRFVKIDTKGDNKEAKYMGGELERVDVRKEDFYADKEGQLSFLDPDVVNYFPTASDYGRIPNRFIERYSSISYLANLGLMAAIQNVTLRDARNYEGTREGELYKKIAEKGKANFADGLVSCIPVSQFLKIYGLSTGGHNYSTLQELYNGHLMANQWNIIYEDKEIISWMAVVVATAYVKETGSLYVKFNSDLQDVLLNLKRDYGIL